MDIALQKPATANPLGSILDTALDAVIVMNSKGIIVDWNDVAASTFGWTRIEATGALLCDLIIPLQFRDAHRRGLETFLRTGEGPVLRKRIEVTALRKSREEFPVELSITPYPHDGELVFLGFVRDIADRKRAAERLERQVLQAKLLYEVISFASEANSLESALQTCLEAVGKLTGWPVGHVYLPADNDPDLLLPSNIWHPAEDHLYATLKSVTAKTRFSIGHGLPGLVLQTGDPLWISDVITDRRFTRAKEVNNLGVTSAIGFPIKNAGSIIAVVEFFTPVPSEPDPELLYVLRSIGDQVGRVFERRLTETRLQQTSEHQKLLLAELNHRVKNMLTVVTGIAAQTMRNSASMQDFKRSFLERLNALSQAHSLLASQNWGATPLKEMVDQILSPYVDASARISVEGPAVDLSPKNALAISLVLHELVTNAAKYGALSQPSGQLSICWRTATDDPSRLKLSWRESGVANAAEPSKGGFGTRLINATVKQEMRGNLTVRYEKDGIRYDMDLPLAPAISTAIETKIRAEVD